MDLSIEIPRKTTKLIESYELTECLKTFVSPEKMEECGYKC